MSSHERSRSTLSSSDRCFIFSTADTRRIRRFPSRAHMGNRYLPLGIGAVVVLQLLFTYAPPFQRMFDVASIPLAVWPWLFLGGAVFFLVVEAEKFVVRSLRLNQPGKTAEDSLKPLIAPQLREGPPRGLFNSSGVWAATLGGLAVLGLIGGEVYTLLRQQPADAVTEKVDHDVIRRVFHATGVVQDRETSELRAKVSGVIKSVDCTEGQEVAAGLRCATITAPQLEGVGRAGKERIGVRGEAAGEEFGSACKGATGARAQARGTEAGKRRRRLSCPVAR